MITCSDCFYFIKNEIYCKNNLCQSKINEYWQEDKCLGFNKKESVKTMNRKEAVIYLIDNKKGVVKCLDGNYFVWLKNGFIMCGDIIRHDALADGESFQLTVPDCEENFEVVRELRKMSFGEAYWYYRNKNISDDDMKVVDSECDTKFGDSDAIISKSDYKGLWTIEGVYE